MVATLEEIPLTRDLSIQTDDRVEFARDKLHFQQTMNMWPCRRMDAPRYLVKSPSPTAQLA